MVNGPNKRQPNSLLTTGSFALENSFDVESASTSPLSNLTSLSFLNVDDKTGTLLVYILVVPGIFHSDDLERDQPHWLYHSRPQHESPFAKIMTSGLPSLAAR